MISLAQLYMDDGELKEARQLWELALFWRPEKPGALMVASMGLMLCGDIKPAKELLEKLVLLPLPSASEDWTWHFKLQRSWFNLALCRGNLGDLVGCMQALQETLKLNPKDAEALKLLAQTLVDIGRVEEALPYVDKALVFEPQFVGAWITKGNVLDMLGRSEDAIACYDKALAIDSRATGAWGNKCIALGAMGRHEEAVACADKGLQIDPRDVKAWFNKGCALGNLKRYQDALGCFQEAQKLGDPNAAKFVERCQRQLKSDEVPLFDVQCLACPIPTTTLLRTPTRISIPSVIS